MVETVVVTAAAGTFPGLAETLRAIPVAVEEYPLMNFEAPADWAAVDAALGRLAVYGAVAVTSPRAAAAVADRIEAGRVRIEAGASPVAWAGGAATAAALRATLGTVRTPDERNAGRWGAAVALANAMIAAGAVGPVLFLCGESRREELPERLRSRSIQVDEVACYRSILASESAAQAAARRSTVLIVASPSVADLLARACPPEVRPDLVAVGPTTASHARALGWPPRAVASEPTGVALRAAVQDVLATRRPHE